MGLDLIKKIRETAEPILMPDGTVNLDMINFSSGDQYLKCGEQYRFRHMLGLKSPPSVAMVEGTAHHKACEMDNREKIDKGKSLDASKTTEIFVETFRNEVKVAEKECDELKVKLPWEEETDGSVIKRGKIFQADYMGKHSKLIKPEFAEKTFTKEVDVDGVKFRMMGQIDLGQRRRISDYKVTKRMKSKGELSESLQLSLYTWAADKPEAEYICFVKTKTPYVARVDVPKTNGDKLWALKVMASVVKAIRKGSFPLARPDSMSWWCSEKFCGYWSRCRGKM